MNDIEYLNQIAMDNRAVAMGGKDRVISPKALKMIGIGVLAAILIMIIGMILGGLGNGERDILDRIYARTTNLNATILEYNNSVKSSELRAMGNSLATVLTETSSKIAGVLTEEYGTVEARDEAVTSEEATHIGEVNASLYYGKINGFLDRYYVREMTKEITLLQTLESEALEGTKNTTVSEALVSSWNNLERLREQFEGFVSL